MFGLEVVDDSGEPDQIRTKAVCAAELEDGLITWECGASDNVIGLVPPLIVSDDEVRRAFECLRLTLAAQARHS